MEIKRAWCVLLTVLPSFFAVAEQDAGWVIRCEGKYKWHLQGVATDGQSIYWSFSDCIVKTDRTGRRTCATPPDKLHYGDLCVADGTVYVAYNGGEFNQESGAASRVLAFKSSDLTPCGSWDVPEVVHGAGGMTYHDGSFYVVGGLPPNHVRNYIYRYSRDFKFKGRIDLPTGYTMLGIQAIDFIRDSFLIGIYPDIHDSEIGIIRTPADFSDFERLPYRGWVGMLELNGMLYQGFDRTLPEDEADANGFRETGFLVATPYPAPAESFAGGLWKTFDYPAPDTQPIVFSGWSKADGVMSAEYCLYLDIEFADGTWFWGATADFRCGTHTWERTAGVYVPEKPVKSIRFYALNRNVDSPGCGKAEFRNLKVERREGRKDGEVIYESVRSNRPLSDEEYVHEVALTGRAVAERDYLRPASVGAAQPGLDGLPAPGSVTVWTANPMRRVTPLTYPSAAECAARPAISIELARNERESAQILVTAGKGAAWADGTLEIGELKSAAGAKFRGTLVWERVGYVRRGFEGLVHPSSPDPRELWIPDPLLPAAPFGVRENATQGLWLTAYAAPDAKPGVYRGVIAVKEGGTVRARVAVAVKVLPFALPATFGTWNSFTVMDSFTRAQYPDAFAKMKRQSWDIMLEHRLNPDDISRTTPPDVGQLKYAVKRGLNLFNILNVVPEPTDGNAKITYEATPETYADPKFYAAFAARLKPLVEGYRKEGLLKYAYIYGFDEVEKDCYPGIASIYRNLKRDFPDVPVMNISRVYRDVADGTVEASRILDADWLCPDVNTFDAKRNGDLRAKGKKVWWYTTFGPTYPYANFASLEAPPLDGRMLLGFMTHGSGADGYLYWHVNYWEDGAKSMDEGDTFLPDWNTHCPGRRMSAGDGILLYPGKDHVLPSIRLAMVRDGIEDREWLKMAADSGLPTDAILGRAVRSPTDYERDPQSFLRLRAEVGALLSGKSR